MNKKHKIVVTLVSLLFILTATLVCALAQTAPLASTSDSPVITNAFLSPQKVRAGDIMLITAEAQDNYGIKSVTADMAGLETIQLNLIDGNVKKYE